MFITVLPGIVAYLRIVRKKIFFSFLKINL